MSTLVDQAERDRFIREHGKNISVIAPAGVGKTTSIVERILHIAQMPEAQAIDRLSRLVVVTYSVRAAQQMQQKARAAMRERGVPTRIRRALQQTFFGTIHSYCVRLLERFGHYLGLPSPVALLRADEELWNRFLVRGLGRQIVEDRHLRDLFHFYPPDKLYALGKDISPGDELDVPSPPEPQLQRVFDYRDNALYPSTLKTIVRAQEAARIWSDAWKRNERFRPLPKCPASVKAAAFAEIWNEAFAPLHHWLRHAALAFGRHVANAYEHFRLAEAVMTYDDQVRLARRALDHPAAARELAAERLSVLLDEAQDTDRRQFEVLQRVAGIGPDLHQADDQSFCIVGDFQQAIYAPRSDLAVYRRVHEEISVEPRGASSRLQVTFRCDHAIIDFANAIFPSLLNDARGQCAFETLAARHDAGPGQVVRWLCPDEPEHAAGGRITADVRARHEARFVARRLHDLGPAGVGASDWSQVAVLCPRKNWLLDIQRELTALDLPVQLHSSNEEQRERTAGAWLTSLIWIAAHPEDSFEIAGVLREILGVSDSDMARHTGGDGDKLRLDRFALEGDGSVDRALATLREACANADSMPLHLAIQQLAEKTRLRERLNSIPELEAENAGRELDDFLGRVAGRSAEGATLAELAQELRLDLTQGHPEEEEIREAIQLLTSHKSKGLEWQAVVVPYVFRLIETKSLAYPRLVSGEGGQEIVVRDKADYASQVRDFVTERDRQQLQRLLYVMTTRARHTLVLIDDEALFGEAARRSGWPAGELLGLSEGPNRAVWQALPEVLSAAESVSPVARKPSPDIAAPPGLSHEELRHAMKRARVFPHRITPHALAVHARDEAEPEKQVEREEDRPVIEPSGPGILYGTWWHEFIQALPWSQSMDAWQQKFTVALARSPLPERSEWEWNLFRNSSFARWLAEPGRLIQVELPFLWRATGEPCLEGVMDLAVYTESASEWQVIDWKTNRVPEAGSGSLVEIYRGQIEAYVRALREILSAPVRGSLYLTQTGEWVEVTARGGDVPK
jgi:ATP-dependent exoDNAse (exonuclease V) beta subunit